MYCVRSLKSCLELPWKAPPTELDDLAHKNDEKDTGEDSDDHETDIPGAGVPLDGDEPVRGGRGGRFMIQYRKPLPSTLEYANTDKGKFKSHSLYDPSENKDKEKRHYEEKKIRRNKDN